MTRNVIVVPPELTLNAAWQIMVRQHIRHLPVVRAGALVGMLSDRDILSHAYRVPDGAVHVPEKLIVAEVMTPTPIETCETSTDVADLARTMTEKKIDAIPVVRGLKLVGLVTSTDLILLLIDRNEARPLPFDFTLIDETHSGVFAVPAEAHGSA